MEVNDTEGSVIFDKNTNNKDVELTHDEIWDDSLLIQHYDETMIMARQHLATKLTSVSSITDSDCSNSHRTEPVNGYSHSKVHSSLAAKKKKKKKGRKKNEWHTGDPCRAHYSEDGKVYEATIVGINNARGSCTVRYLGYNNHEEATQSSLLKSKGEGARRRQLQEVAHSFNQNDDRSSEGSYGVESDAETENEERMSKLSREDITTKATSQTLPPPPPPRVSHSPLVQSDHSFPHIPNLPPPPALGLVDGSDPLTSEALHTMLMSWYMTGYHTGYYQGLTHGKKLSNKKDRYV